MNDTMLGMEALSPRDRMEKLIALCEDRLRDRPKDLAARIELAKVLLDSGQRSRGLEYLRGLLEANPGNAVLRGMIQGISQGIDSRNRGHQTSMPSGVEEDRA